MDRDAWIDRVKYRSDISMRLVHLTKEAAINGVKYDSMDILMKILMDKRLIGSTTKTGYICGKRSAVCFQDAPLYSISQNVEFEKAKRKEGKDSKVRYRGYGLLFEKSYIYEMGGRPVIYEKTDEAKKWLPEDQW